MVRKPNRIVDTETQTILNLLTVNVHCLMADAVVIAAHLPMA